MAAVQDVEHAVGEASGQCGGRPPRHLGARGHSLSRNDGGIMADRLSPARPPRPGAERRLRARIHLEDLTMLRFAASRSRTYYNRSSSRCSRRASGSSRGGPRPARRAVATARRSARSRSSAPSAARYSAAARPSSGCIEAAWPRSRSGAAARRCLQERAAARAGDLHRPALVECVAGARLYGAPGQASSAARRRPTRTRSAITARQLDGEHRRVRLSALGGDSHLRRRRELHPGRLRGLRESAAGRAREPARPRRGLVAAAGVDWKGYARLIAQRPACAAGRRRPQGPGRNGRRQPRGERQADRGLGAGPPWVSYRAPQPRAGAGSGETRTELPVDAGSVPSSCG